MLLLQNGNQTDLAGNERMEIELFGVNVFGFISVSS